jgi:hypothetical protein
MLYILYLELLNFPLTFFSHLLFLPFSLLSFLLDQAAAQMVACAASSSHVSEAERVLLLEKVKKHSSSVVRSSFFFDCSGMSVDDSNILNKIPLS